MGSGTVVHPALRSLFEDHATILKWQTPNKLGPERWNQLEILHCSKDKHLSLDLKPLLQGGTHYNGITQYDIISSMAGVAPRKLHSGVNLQLKWDDSITASGQGQ